MQAMFALKCADAVLSNRQKEEEEEDISQILRYVFETPWTSFFSSCKADQTRPPRSTNLLHHFVAEYSITREMTSNAASSCVPLSTPKVRSAESKRETIC